MIDVTYDVYCDAEDCIATFTYEGFGKVSDLAGVVRNLRGRGWRREPGGRTICPLHQREEHERTDVSPLLHAVFGEDESGDG